VLERLGRTRKDWKRSAELVKVLCSDLTRSHILQNRMSDEISDYNKNKGCDSEALTLIAEHVIDSPCSPTILKVMRKIETGSVCEDLKPFLDF